MLYNIELAVINLKNIPNRPCTLNEFPSNASNFRLSHALSFSFSFSLCFLWALLYSPSALVGSTRIELVTFPLYLRDSLNYLTRQFK
jgi:hypothetical protein